MRICWLRWNMSKANPLTEAIIVAVKEQNRRGDGNKRKRLPFKLDRASSDCYKLQLVEGLREAIRIGYYKAGDMLPSLRQAASELGVSDIVVRGAYRTLSAEGLSVSRKGQGSVIHPPKTPIWRGHVLCLTTDFDFSLCQCGIVEKLRERLTRNGYLFSQVPVLTAKDGTVDFRGLERAILRPVDFIFLTKSQREIERRISASGIPFAVYGRDPVSLPEGCVGCVPTSSKKAISLFVARCCTRKIQRVEIVCCKKINAFAESLLRNLEDAGVEVTARWVRNLWGVERVEDAERSGYDFVRRNCSRKSYRWPDLYYVCDDHVAKGMLMAFAELGVCVPEEVRFTCSATAGFRPIFNRNVSVILTAPYRVGEEVARRVLGWLSQRRPFPATPIELTFDVGETFP